MLKGHSGAAASSISHVDIYVYPTYDTTIVGCSSYATNVKSRFGTDNVPIGIDILADVSQYGTVDCNGGGLQVDPLYINLTSGTAQFTPASSTSVSADPAVASLKITAINVSGNDISSNPGEFVTGSYVYRIFGLNQCQGL